eukprot:TCONS_00072032-protein
MVLEFHRTELQTGKEMASKSDSYQTFGSFSLVNGVMVKISDKYLAPPKITLPEHFREIDPTELLQLQYDFTKEKNAILQAEDERANQLRIQQQKELDAKKKQEEEERQEREKEEKERLLLQLQQLEKAKEENLPSQENDNQTARPVTTVEQPSSSYVADIPAQTKVSQSTSASPFAILTPLVVSSNTSQQNAASFSYVKHDNFNMFDPLEFDAQNDNPFESVERDTLNELDELRSVLQPETQPVIETSPFKSDEGHTSHTEFELSSVFNQPLPQPVTTVNELPTENIIAITDIETSTFVSPSYLVDHFASIPHHTSKGTLNWTGFSSPPSTLNQNMNPFASNNPFQANFQSLDSSQNDTPSQMSSKTPPPSLHYVDGVRANIENTNLENQGMTNLQRAKSLPNLDQANQPGPTFESPSPYTMEMENAPVATDRIENIMKQFNFQRMPQTSSPNSQVPKENSIVNDTTSNTFYSTNLSTDSAVQQNLFPTSYNQAIAMPTSSANSLISQPANTQQDYMNYQHQVSLGSVQTNHQMTPDATDYNAGGPLMVHSRIPLHNSGTNLNANTVTSDSIINLSSNTGNPIPSSYSGHPPSTNVGAVNRVYAVPTFGNAISNSPTNYSHIPANNNLQKNLPYKNGEVNSSQPVIPKPPQMTLPKQGVLPDLTGSLSTSERNFADQLSSMGFDGPCVSRTIKRLGMDEKEVLDFLVLVEEVKDQSKCNGEDVEIALLNNQNDKTKVKTYLEMVATFKELGFQTLKIHEALKMNDCDQHKSLDHLTR